MMPVVASSKEGPGGPKLLESMTIENEYGISKYKFEYDAAGRMAKTFFYHGGELYDERAFAYSGDNLVIVKEQKIGLGEIETRFARNGNSITVTCDARPTLTHTIIIGKDLYATKKTSRDEDGTFVETYLYEGGNLVKMASAAQGNELFGEFKYDDKKSPFYNCKTAKWLLQHWHGPMGHNNNVVESHSGGNVGRPEFAAFAYEYDGDGFPAKRTMTVKEDADSKNVLKTETATYAYRGGAAGQAPASLGFPQKINFFRFSKSVSQRPLNIIPEARIWGWSNKGKVAYSIETAIDGRGGQIINFAILDLVSDSIAFELKMDSFDHDDATDETLYILYSDAILGALKKHEIAEQKSEFMRFPIRKNDMIYDCGIANIAHKKSELDFFDADSLLSKYSVLVTASGKKKVIGTFAPVNEMTAFAYVCGYILSPFENRALVVVAEEHWGFEGTELKFRLSGCHLGAGFK
jgi:hypothetical protein